MPLNPYQSPEPLPDSHQALSATRESALVSVRVAIIVLTAAVLFNYHAFDATVLQSGSYRLPILFRVMNLLGIAAVVIACWTLLLPMLQWFGQLLRRVFANQVDPTTWDEALYRSLSPVSLLALLGAILWGIWVVGFYYLKVPFLLISYAVGIPAHIRAAFLYIPLLIRWYKLWRSQSITTEEPVR